MKTLRDYITESTEWMATPAEGDTFAIELPDEVLIETYIIEVADDCILLDSTEEINAALAEWATLEDTDEGDSGVIMETMGYGGLVGEEDEWSQLRKNAADMTTKQMTAPKPAQPKPGFMQQVGDKQIGMIKGLVKGLTGGTSAVEENDSKIDPIIVKALEKMPRGLKGKGLPGDAVFDAARKALALEYGLMKMRYDTEVTTNYVRQLIDLYQRQAAVDKKGSYPGMDEGNIQDLEKDIAAAPVKPIANMEEDDMDEAEYRGRKVALGKPMAGDVKKFKVYVKDPKTGNVKKVNFGHGGKSARRAGQKTMRIRKSNPKARKSFRARHNCANPGPRTKARYWSCRKW